MTRLLLDTHLLLWWLNDDARLPPPVVERVQAPDAEVFVSQVPEQGFRWLPISNAHLLAVRDLESDGVHRDPFDRLLVCQSRVEPMLLLSGDSQLQPVVYIPQHVGEDAAVDL
jgi:PIN domain nuclease of toxin-antitoxin system